MQREKETNDCACLGEKILLTQQSYVCFLETIGNSFPFWALSQELMTTVTRQWHRNARLKTMMAQKPASLWFSTHCFFGASGESQHRDFVKDLTNFAHSSMTHHHLKSQRANRPRASVRDDKYQQGSVVTWWQQWQHPGYDQAMSTPGVEQGINTGSQGGGGQ